MRDGISYKHDALSSISQSIYFKTHNIEKQTTQIK